MPPEKTIGQLITEQALKFPNKVAIKFGDDSITYQVLNKKANQLANFLIANDINIGDKVALATARSIEMVVSILGILRSGGIYIPFDPNFPIERLTFMLADAGNKMLITSKKYEQHFQQTTSKLFIDDIWAQLDSYPADAPDVTLKSDDLAYILYTSGSTGKPKGVLIQHNSLINLLSSMQKAPGLTPDDTWLAIATISFDISVLELLLPVVTGATLIVADSETAKDGRMMLNIIRDHNVTVMQATPYTWRMMLASGWDEKLPLKVITGGEALPQDLADKLLERCGSLHNYYGPTETSVYSTGKQILPGDELITIGKPIDNTQVYILNDELKIVPNGQEGEICIGGAGVGRGYLNRPELTAEKFIDNIYSLENGDKVYRTGDLGKILDNGEIQYLGRIDRQVKLRGYRIETEEVEYNLIKQPGIHNAVVTVYEDKPGDQRLIAYVVATHEDAKRDTHKWIEVLKSKLPEYMVPTDYIPLAAMPMTPNGKIDRKQLPKPIFHHNDIAYTAPATASEKMIADIWSKYLDVESPSIHDNFFAAGGHSLIAVQIMTAIGKITGKLIPIATLFQYPTIHKLAQILQAGDEESTWRSLVAIKPSGSKPPVYIVHGEGLNVLIFNNIAMNVDPEQPVYGIQSRGLNGKDEVPDTIEDLAKLYNDEILEQNPVGPYAIAGYSFGGYVGIEMARQLQAQGKEVIMLAMLDVNYKTPEYHLPPSKLIRTKLVRQVHKAGFILKSLMRQPGVTINYQLLMIKHRLGLVDVSNPDNFPDYMMRIIEKLRAAVHNYEMRPYNGVIHLLRCKVRIYFVDDPIFLGWRPFALKGVKIYDVDGDHRDMLLPPNDVNFARVLQQCLDECNK